MNLDPDQVADIATDCIEAITFQADFIRKDQQAKDALGASAFMARLMPKREATHQLIEWLRGLPAGRRMKVVVVPGPTGHPEAKVVLTIGTIDIIVTALREKGFEAEADQIHVARLRVGGKGAKSRLN